MFKKISKISLLTSVLLLSACNNTSSSNTGSSNKTESPVNKSTDTTSSTTNVDTANNAKESAPSTSSTTSTDGNTVTRSVKDEPYYRYLWHIDSANSKALGISNEVSAALNGIYKVDAVDKNADINVLEAWKISKGKNVIVAVIDDGADVYHEDLKDNIYKTYNADDGSTDVSNPSSQISTFSHGNTCAGFIVAPINGKGTIGTAPESKLIAIAQRETSDANTIKAFEYAKNNGAKVISCSWGTEQVSQVIVDELKSLYNAGITVVFASGNNGKTLDTAGLNDESEVEWVIGIGASGENNDVTPYSNYGQNIDILAPGGDASLSVGILGLDDTGVQGSTENYGLVSDDYSFGAGTSFATPVIAGVIALMYSVNPKITPAQVKEILIDTADKIGGNKAYYRDGFDQKRAYGKVSAYKALLEVQKLL